LNKLKRYSDFRNFKNSLDLLIFLTEFTIPYGQEYLMVEKIQKKCNRTLNKDEFGNLYTVIGDSKILFTAHMDTYSKEVEKINHVVDGNFLKTDGKTILGGDNRVGCAILINMINSGIPGNYYFFCGEEVGRLGSEYHNSKINEDKYLLAITFDRKEIGSVCNYQRGIKLANDNLVDFLISELNKTGYTFFKDNFGLSCDTYSFNNKVNNCLNVSTGVYEEHHKTERVDIKFYESIFDISTKINWSKIEELSKEKVRDTIDLSKFNISNNKISEALDYFIKNGYNPTKIPNINEFFAIYTKELYFKVNPKIFDYFDVLIRPDGLVDINGKVLTKEKVISYISEYKKSLIEFKIDNDNYHIIDIDTSSDSYVITFIKNGKNLEIVTNEKLEYLNSDNNIKLFNYIINIVRGVLLY
jgi:putative aminopeptidase FrvX